MTRCLCLFVVVQLSYKVDWGELKDTFRQWGPVAFANVAKEDNGRSRGWGIVRVTSASKAKRIIGTCKTG